MADAEGRRKEEVKRGTISAVVITFNEEENIKRCLESVKWADEVVVVDGYSEDGTVDIAKQFGAKVIMHRFEGDFGLERNIGNQNAMGDWVLALDADEEVPEATQRAIEQILQEGSEFSAYNILRNQYFLGHFMRYGGRQHRIINLYRRDRTHFEGKVHHLVKVEGAVLDADFAINHYPFNSIEQFIQKHDRYTTYEAAELFDRCARAKSGEILYNLIWKPLKMFFKDYVKKKGYRDGTYGLIFCVLFAWSHFLKWAKYWETCEKKEGRKRLK